MNTLIFMLALAVGEIATPFIQQIGIMPDGNELRFTHRDPMTVEVFRIERALVGTTNQSVFWINPLKTRREQLANQVGETFIWRDTNALPGVAYEYRVQAISQTSVSSNSILSISPARIASPIPSRLERIRATLPQSPPPMFDPLFRTAKVTPNIQSSVVAGTNMLVLTWNCTPAPNLVCQIQCSADLKTWTIFSEQPGLETNACAVPGWLPFQFFRVGNSIGNAVTNLVMDP